jgi:hypothetical protein
MDLKQLARFTALAAEVYPDANVSVNNLGIIGKIWKNSNYVEVFKIVPNAEGTWIRLDELPATKQKELTKAIKEGFRDIDFEDAQNK